jgi:hypothetical protein
MCQAFCLTDYKVQGSTLTAAILDLKNDPTIRGRDRHQKFCSLYVQLSRLQSSKGLYLPQKLDLGGVQFGPDPRLLTELERLRADEAHVAPLSRPPPIPSRRRLQIIFRARRLFQQYEVDVGATIEQNRLTWFRNQNRIRADMYKGLADSLSLGTDEDGEARVLGRRVVLPSSGLVASGPCAPHSWTPWP